MPLQREQQQLRLDLAPPRGLRPGGRRAGRAPGDPGPPAVRGQVRGGPGRGRGAQDGLGRGGQ